MQHVDLNYLQVMPRDFEPKRLCGYSYCRDVSQLDAFLSRWTGDTKYLARIPDAFEFLESIRYNDAQLKQLGKSCKTGTDIVSYFCRSRH